MTHRTFDDPNSIDARQALLDNRCERKHPKRHRTMKRSSKRNALARQRGAHKASVNIAVKRRYIAAVRAYWTGERDEHP